MNSIYLILLSFISAFGGDATTTLPELQPMERAHVQVDFLKKNFKKTLTDAVSKKGPAQAVDACKVDAPKALQGAGAPKAEPGEVVEVGRTSLKLRNPENAPREWVKPYLEKFAKLSPQEIPKKTLVPLGEGHYGYLEPIFVESMCLNCHGAQIAPTVQGALKVSYPQDQATGFEAGQLRGVFWLESRRK